MIKINQIKQLYSIEKNILTTRDILDVGFTRKEIEQLVEIGYLSHKRQGIYEINREFTKRKFTESITNNTNLAHLYGNLLVDKDIYGEDAFYVVSVFIRNQRYDEALEIIIKMLNANNKLSIHNLLLLIISLFKNLTTIVEPYNTYVSDANIYEQAQKDLPPFKDAELEIYMLIIDSLKKQEFENVIEVLDKINYAYFNPFLSLLIEIFYVNYLMNAQYKSKLAQSIKENNYSLTKKLLEISLKFGTISDMEKLLLEQLNTNIEKTVKTSSQGMNA